MVLYILHSDCREDSMQLSSGYFGCSFFVAARVVVWLSLWLHRSLCLCDTVRWRGCLSCYVVVCVSVTLMYCAQTIESIIMRPLPACSPAILVFLCQI